MDHAFVSGLYQEPYDVVVLSTYSSLQHLEDSAGIGKKIALVLRGATRLHIGWHVQVCNVYVCIQRVGVRMCQQIVHHTQTVGYDVGLES
jgi:hypothetical protein